MIYHIYFSGLQSAFNIYTWGALPDKIKTLEGTVVNIKEELSLFMKASTDCSFVFVITKKFQEEFNLFVEKYKLNDLIVYEMPEYITNDVHPHNGRNIKMYVMASPNHFWRDWYTDAETLFEGEENED